MRLKVTDGDVVIVNVEGEEVDNSWIENYRNLLEKWAKSRGLNNVVFIVSGGNVRINMSIMSVNDVFEQQVLNKE